MAPEILIVDDEADIRGLIAEILRDEGYEAREAASDKEAYAAVAARQPALMILDVWLNGSEHDGIQILENIKKNHPSLPVIMISGHGTVDMAVSATKIGAYDFIAKPFKTDVLLHTIERALSEAKLRKENEELKKLSGEGEHLNLVGQSSVITEIQKEIERVAEMESRVLITGDPGSGKNFVAKLIHKQSPRKDGPFVVLNCAALSSEKVEETLFGVEQTPDTPRKVGLLEEAHSGILLLDEVADMPLDTQGRIVRVLHSQKFQRLGGEGFVEVNVRVLATSNKNLQQLMENGLFREDLYYRLNVVPLNIPPLVERRDDIPDLAKQLLKKRAIATGRATPILTEDAVSVLQTHEWPGNVWELANIIERALIIAQNRDNSAISGDVVNSALSEQSESKLMSWSRAPEVLNKPLREARESFEREYLMFHLDRFGGNISRTAEFVGMDRAALHRKLKGLGVQSNTKSTGS
ncbi:nitrogen assimilation response regulator NtrX [Curvivirga aplysinae]|uniref:nitrogen assimilation response regulator NtrX n=1 Tax=Curvivirga aplysinae TaxID=2529852 RepID=UPI0012BB76FA|nr:sigma-54 dependent transcriptional regulator [Curvivirga aplysinae]MTI10063.1 sigma-54-dependent Fis family transcriptional regulator [Curvivirga aplysinae]